MTEGELSLCPDGTLVREGDRFGVVVWEESNTEAITIRWSDGSVEDVLFAEAADIVRVSTR